MKKLMGSFLAKTVAVALAVLLVFALAGSVLGIVYSVAGDRYDGASFYDSELCSALMRELLQAADDSVIDVLYPNMYFALETAAEPYRRAYVERADEGEPEDENAVFATPAPLSTEAAQEGVGAGLQPAPATPGPASTAAPGTPEAPERDGAADMSAVSVDYDYEQAEALLKDWFSSVRLPENFGFRVTAPDGRVLYSRGVSDDAVSHPDWTLSRYGYVDSADGSITTYYVDGGAPGETLDAERCAVYRIDGFLPKTLKKGDVIYTAARLDAAVVSHNAAFYAAAGVSLLLLAAVLAFLLAAAGRTGADAELRLCWVHRIPTDVLYALCIALGAAALDPLLLAPRLLMLRNIAPFATVAVLSLTAITLLFLLLCMSTAARVKTHTFLKNSVSFRILRLVWRILRSAARGLGVCVRSLPLLWKLLAAVALYALVTLLAMATQNPIPALLWIAASLAGLVLLCRLFLSLQKLREGGARLAAGDLSYQIPTEGMHGACREHAEHLNSIAAGMSRAVDARMKSERMKTDLITNVSHDLKTPLTSIVNYVDLLKKEDLHNPTAAGYVAVLDRQAERLKKLTTDLVEASKAQSGALNVNLAPTDVRELLAQLDAEYRDRFGAAQLTPVLTLPETPLIAMADGRLLFRVLDNLLGNAVKYSLPGTRVYLSAAPASDGNAEILVRNISREALNIDPAELTERFVRGDASRATEGSGLGLSIADDLMKLQGGSLKLAIDGDLFRAAIVLPMAAEA